MPCFAGSTATCPGGTILRFRTIRTYRNSAGSTKRRNGAADRSDELFDRQKQFIGNASHELQTPLAVLGNRLEWLLDRTELTEEQMGELFQSNGRWAASYGTTEPCCF